MNKEELEKRNFHTWCRYDDANELENAKGENHEVWETLYSEYVNEIGIQKFDLSLKISI